MTSNTIRSNSAWICGNQTTSTSNVYGWTTTAPTYQYYFEQSPTVVAVKEKEENFDRTKELDDFLDSFPII